VLRNIRLFIIHYVKLLAAMALIAAGAIHTFPVLWQAWDEQMKRTPELHGVIGAIAFTLGLANLGILMFEVSNCGTAFPGSVTRLLFLPQRHRERRGKRYEPQSTQRSQRRN
jgi:hypothetical protein